MNIGMRIRFSGLRALSDPYHPCSDFSQGNCLRLFAGCRAGVNGAVADDSFGLLDGAADSLQYESATRAQMGRHRRTAAHTFPRGWCSVQRIKNNYDCRGQSYII